MRPPYMGMGAMPPPAHLHVHPGYGTGLGLPAGAHPGLPQPLPGASHAGWHGYSAATGAPPPWLNPGVGGAPLPALPPAPPPASPPPLPPEEDDMPLASPPPPPQPPASPPPPPPGADAPGPAPAVPRAVIVPARRSQLQAAHADEAAAATKRCGDFCGPQWLCPHDVQCFSGANSLGGLQHAVCMFGIGEAAAAIDDAKLMLLQPCVNKCLSGAACHLSGMRTFFELLMLTAPSCVLVSARVRLHRKKNRDKRVIHRCCSQHASALTSFALLL